MYTRFKRMIELPLARTATWYAETLRLEEIGQFLQSCNSIMRTGLRAPRNTWAARASSQPPIATYLDVLAPHLDARSGRGLPRSRNIIGEVRFAVYRLPRSCADLRRAPNGNRTASVFPPCRPPLRRLPYGTPMVLRFSIAKRTQVRA